MTADKSLECAQLFAEGYPMAEAARRAGIQESTLRKAIPQLAAISIEYGASTKGERRREDTAAANAMGTGLHTRERTGSRCHGAGGMCGDPF